MSAVAIQVARDEGSVVVFSGHLEEEGRVYGITFAVDHRMAQDIYDVIVEDGECPVELEGWQILSKRLIMEGAMSDG